MARKRTVFLDRLHPIAVLKPVRRACRQWRWFLLGVMAVVLLVGWPLHPGVQIGVAAPPIVAPGPESLLQQGLTLYQAQQFAAAIPVLEQAVQTGDSPLNRAQALNLLSLSHQKLGQWQAAARAITAAQREFTLISRSSPETLAVQAKVLNTQGQLQFAQGQSEAALRSWEQAEVTYRQAQDLEGTILSQINQAQALQALGLYQRAIDRLIQVELALQAQPRSRTKAMGMRSLGNALRVVGNLDQAQQLLQQTLTIAQELTDRQLIADSFMGLGTIAQAQQKASDALEFYQQAAAQAPQALTKTQAQINQLRLLIAEQQWPEAWALVTPLHTQIVALPPNRASLYAQINFAQSLNQLQQTRQALNQKPAQMPAIVPAQIVATAAQQAQQLGDTRAEADALGQLGRFYEQTQQWAIAQDLTQQALFRAQAMQARDLTYRWHWQAGRIAKAQGQRAVALSAYTQAVGDLKALRSDLVSVNPDVQFSFRDSVEPIYREYVSLLLQPEKAEVSQQRLVEARNAIESLQLAELEDFFRQACLTPNTVQIDQVDRQAAVLYPIMLPDRLEVILSLPGRPLQHHAVPVPQTQVETTVRELRTKTTRLSNDFLPIAQEVYDWLIRPFEAELKQQQIKTLVFVLDGLMRNVPMSVLHDGKQFLIEQYATALAPGLELLDVRPLPREELGILAAGLSEGRQGFTPLPSVATEIGRIETELPSRVLLNDSFTIAALRDAVKTSTSPIIHLATHGEFSSKADRTFILTWDDRLDIRQLTNLLQVRNTTNQTPIELLVLSACRTAVGDRRAALGLAGVAVRAGARSTIGTLWYVSDEATSSVMVKFYEELSTGQLIKAESLRQAQLSLLKTAEYNHPYFWSPYILVGNWL